MEPHAPKGQRTLFDEGCTEQKRLSDEQSGELRVRLDPDIARRVEQHERQHAAAIAAQVRGIAAQGIGHSSPGQRLKGECS